MESKDELKGIDIKNSTCYYFDDIVKVRDRDVDFIDDLLDKKLYNKKQETIFIYDISYKTLPGTKPLCIRFDKTDLFIKIHDGIRYLVLFDRSGCAEICDRIKYLLSEKSGITDSINHNFTRIRIDSYHSLPIEKISIFNAIIPIKSVIS